MLQKGLIVWAGLIAGVILGILLTNNTNLINLPIKKDGVKNSLTTQKKNVIKSKKVIGFLPFWLIDKARSDYSSYITQLSYFNVTIDSDGSIQKYTAPGQSDPGWHALFTGKVDTYLADAKSKGVELSLTVFSGNDKKIDSFIADPKVSAQNLMNDLGPILTQYGFTDLNLDIEKVADATTEEREKYTEFVTEVRRLLNPNITITIDLPCIAFVKDDHLTNPKTLSKVANYLVIMGYDFHNPGSYVTGPVAPQKGAGIISEFDIESAVTAALTITTADKLILAVPLYGYSWETINPVPRSATLPASAYSISSRSIEELLSSCTNCTTEFDETDGETHTIYKDEDTGIYHQIFYPDKISTKIKTDFAKSQNLGGMALWALGYEGQFILEPLAEYRR